MKNPFGLFALICASLLLSTRAHAELCRYETRLENPFLQDFDREINGSLSCFLPGTALPMETVFAARLPHAFDRAAVNRIVRQYISVVCPGDETLHVMRESGSLESGLFLELQSNRRTGSSAHVAFLARSLSGTVYLMLFTGTPERVFSLNGALKHLQMALPRERGLLDLE